MGKENLIQLHRLLSNLQESLAMNGVPMWMDDPVKSITDVQVIIEDLLKQLKQKEKDNDKLSTYP